MGKFKMHLLAIIGVLTAATLVEISVPHALAQGGMSGTISGSRYTSARAAALGQAFIPLADDGASALFYQPSALGKLRGTHFEPINFTVQGNSAFFGQAGLSSVKIGSLSGYSPTLKSNPDTLTGVGFQLAPTFFTRGFAFGLLLRSDLGGQYVSATDKIRTLTQTQLIPTAGYGFKLASGVFRMGYSVQWVNKSVGDASQANDGTQAYTKGIAQGVGFSHTIGATLTIPVEFLPQIDVVARDVLGTSYSGTPMLVSASNASGAPAKEKMTMDAAFSLHPKGGDGMNFHLIAQIRDAMNATSTAILSRVSFGTEFDFRNSFFLRFGFGNGYPSAGIGFRRQLAEFGLAYYSNELSQSFRGNRETFFMLQYQLRAF